MNTNRSDERPYGDLVRRAALPEILFVGDLAAALDCSRRTVRALIRSGALAPSGRLGGRAFMFRRDVIRSLARTLGSDPDEPKPTDPDGVDRGE